MRARRTLCAGPAGLPRVTAYGAGVHRGPRLEPITPATVEAALSVRVRADQERFVTPVATSLDEAYAHDEVAWPRLIVDDDRAVGFVMAFLDIDWLGDGTRSDVRSGLWRLNIVADEQGRGHGRFAVEAVAAEIRRRGGTRMYTTYEPDALGPGSFYARLGFRPTGETSGLQTVAELRLDPSHG